MHTIKPICKVAPDHETVICACHDFGEAQALQVRQPHSQNTQVPSIHQTLQAKPGYTTFTQKANAWYASCVTSALLSEAAEPTHGWEAHGLPWATHLEPLGAHGLPPASAWRAIWGRGNPISIIPQSIQAAFVLAELLLNVIPKAKREPFEATAGGASASFPLRLLKTTS